MAKRKKKETPAESPCNHCRRLTEFTICDKCRCRKCRRLVVLCECWKGK